MAKGGKYIIYKEHPTDDDYDVIPIIFPKQISHDLMADTLKKTFKDLVIISAGFVSILNNNLITYGDSYSLNISSRPEDNFIINKVILENIVL